MKNPAQSAGFVIADGLEPSTLCLKAQKVLFILNFQ